MNGQAFGVSQVCPPYTVTSDQKYLALDKKNHPNIVNRDRRSWWLVGATFIQLDVFVPLAVRVLLLAARPEY